MPTADGTGWEADADNSEVAVYYTDKDGKRQVTTADDVVVTGNEHPDERIQAVQQQLDAEEQAFQQQVVALMTSIDSQNTPKSTQGDLNTQDENQEPRTKNQETPEGDLIPQDEKGNLLFEQARPELTVQFLKENFDPEEIAPTVVARINAINKEIAKQEAFKPTGNIQKDALTKQEKKQALNALNEQLGYWENVKQQVTPREETSANVNSIFKDNEAGERCRIAVR